MKLLKVSLTGLDRFSSPLEVDFFAEQRVQKDDAVSVYEFTDNKYTNNLLSFVGLNASGKTSVLRVLSFVFDFLNCTPINNSQFKDILNGSSDVIIDTFVSKDGFIYKLHSEITLNDSAFSSGYEISSEYILKKSAKCAKKDIYSFDEYISRQERNPSSEFLKSDISIIISLNKNNGFVVRNLLEFTDFNFLPIIGTFPKELISFLDPSIEAIKFADETSVSLKFAGRSELTLQSVEQLVNYLSSGTVKGLLVFISAMIAFQEGGYLIIDELENHFNREIVATLLRFFKDRSVNYRGATVIFSTHYPELLDQIDRMDSIYFVRNTDGISIRRLNEELPRNDLKKSDIYISDYLGGTAPSYSAYMELRKAILHGRILEKRRG